MGETLFLGGGILLLEHRKRGVRKKNKIIAKACFSWGGCKGCLIWDIRPCYWDAIYHPPVSAQINLSGWLFHIVFPYVARYRSENDQMCCLYFVYFCVFLFLVPSSVSLLVFYVFLCFPGFFVLSSWVYLSSCPRYRVALGCSSMLFFNFVMCFMCFRVFSLIFISMSLLVFCVFLCFCVYIFYCCIHVVGSTVSVFFVFLCLFFFLSKVFSSKSVSKGGGVIISTVRSPKPYPYPEIRP